MVAISERVITKVVFDMFMVVAFFSFVPSENLLGFGASDSLELFLTVVLAAFLMAFRSPLRRIASAFAARTGWCMLLLAVLPAALRLALLPHHPVPSPAIYDEFSHLLVADTLRHFRFANPPLAFPQFFETFFVLQQPTYSSIYPMGQGICLALGRALFGTPWAGVVLSVSALCAFAYWMLRGWVRPVWALLGGLLAVIEFGPLNQWMNGYWGGAVPAAAGCLVFGALPRLVRERRVRDGALLGVGLAMHLLTRPYESLFLFLSVALYLAPAWPEWKHLLRPGVAAAAFVALALGVTMIQNRAVTGSALMLPYSLSQYQYGVPAALTFQPDPTPHRTLTPQQELDYRMQTSFHGPGPESIAKFLTRLEYRVRFYRFYFLPALYVALIGAVFAFVDRVRDFRAWWVLATLVFFALGVNFFPNWQFHYIAAATCLFLLVSVVGLEKISRIHLRGFHSGEEAALILIALCFAHFGFRYAMHLFDNQEFSIEMRRYETWDSINHAAPERRAQVNVELAQQPGKQLVFVRYWPQHIFQDEWIWNDAEINEARVIWARDLGEEENQKLKKLYPDRTTWILEPDARPPRLSH